MCRLQRQSDPSQSPEHPCAEGVFFMACLFWCWVNRYARCTAIAIRAKVMPPPMMRPVRQRTRRARHITQQDVKGHRNCTLYSTRHYVHGGFFLLSTQGSGTQYECPGHGTSGAYYAAMSGQNHHTHNPCRIARLELSAVPKAVIVWLAQPFLVMTQATPKA